MIARCPEQHGGPGEGRQGVRRPDHPDDGGRPELLRADLPPDHGRVPRSEAVRSHLDEHLGRQRIRDAVKATGRTQLIIAGLWTEVCVAMPAIQALKAGCELRGDGRLGRHLGGGARPGHPAHGPGRREHDDLAAVMLEWQRDWAHQGTYVAVNDVVRQHSGAYGMGVNFAKSMFGGGEGGAAASTAAPTGACAGTAFGQPVTLGEAPAVPTAMPQPSR